MMRRLVAWVALIALLGACGGRNEPAEFPASYPRPATELELPEPAPAVPAFLAVLDPPAAQRDAAKVQGLTGVALATSVALKTVTIGGQKLRLGAVDPVVFRSLAPSVTRDAEFVWSALLAGNAVVSLKAARKLGLTDKNKITIDGDRIDIGAFAESGSPAVADVLIDRRLAEELGLIGTEALMIGTNSIEDRDAVAHRLERAMGGRLKRLVPQVPEVFGSAEPQPRGTAQGGLIGRMNYKILDNGFIEPDPNWVAANIVNAEVPILGSVTCHRLLVPQMASALAEVEREGLSSLIDTSDYGGCFVPRFISRDPTRALSMHAFGLAFDLNVQSNLYGTEGDMDPRLVQILERWGFEWGGRWDPPDPMHFELNQLIQSAS
jgi:hypothetical protein